MLTWKEYKESHIKTLIQEFNVRYFDALDRSDAPSVRRDYWNSIYRSASRGETVTTEVLDNLTDDERNRILKEFPNTHSFYVPVALRHPKLVGLNAIVFGEGFGGCDLWAAIAGKLNAKKRVAIMKHLTGEKLPQARCGYGAVIDAILVASGKNLGCNYSLDLIVTAIKNAK